MLSKSVADIDTGVVGWVDAGNKGKGSHPLLKTILSLTLNE